MDCDEVYDKLLFKIEIFVARRGFNPLPFHVIVLSVATIPTQFLSLNDTILHLCLKANATSVRNVRENIFSKLDKLIFDTIFYK